MRIVEHVNNLSTKKKLLPLFLSNSRERKAEMLTMNCTRTFLMFLIQNVILLFWRPPVCFEI